MREIPLPRSRSRDTLAAERTFWANKQQEHEREVRLAQDDKGDWTVNNVKVHDSFCRCRECKPPMTSRMEAEDGNPMQAFVLAGTISLAIWALMYLLYRCA